MASLPLSLAPQVSVVAQTENEAVTISAVSKPKDCHCVGNINLSEKIIPGLNTGETDDPCTKKNKGANAGGSAEICSVCGIRLSDFQHTIQTRVSDQP